MASSGRPSKYRVSTSPKLGSSGAAAANSVMQERSFIASTGPRIRSAVLSSTAATAAGALAQAGSEHRMAEVGAGLGDA